MSLINLPHKKDENPVYVYEWNAWVNCLFPAIYTNAIRIEAKVRQSNMEILKQVETTRGFFLFHINLTKTAFFFKKKEALLIQLKDKGIIPLNADIDDTSKKYLQSVCQQTGLNTTSAFIEGDENELLIVKTNLNFGGRPEKKLARSLLQRLNPRSRNSNNVETTYPVLERKKIKKHVWKDKDLAVEKYIANRHNYIYRVYKLLNKIVISEAIEESVIKKMITVTQRINHCYHLDERNFYVGGDEKFNSMLADIVRLSNALNIDFAAIDIVRSDEDKYYIIDVNLTPHWNRIDQTDMIDFLATGLPQPSAGLLQHADKERNLVSPK